MNGMVDQAETEFEVAASGTADGEAEAKPGATARFPYDRMTVERFREAFPQARWRDDLRAWFVPGARARARLDRWGARDFPAARRFADERGRDAFAFEPIMSRYLEAGAHTLLVRTPYSRTVVESLRAVPWAAWDSEARTWRVPYRAYEALKAAWPVIEAAAERNEPEAKRRRVEERRGTAEHAEALAKAAERRRRRYPVPLADPPPLGRPVMTHLGPVVFEGTMGEIAEGEPLRRFYALVAAGEDLVWGTWRPAGLSELVATWPARQAASEAERSRGWWHLDRGEIREARRQARSRQRARERAGQATEDEDRS
jgi:hypothetical protein